MSRLIQVKMLVDEVKLFDAPMARYWEKGWKNAEVLYEVRGNRVGLWIQRVDGKYVGIGKAGKSPTTDIPTIFEIDGKPSMNVDIYDGYGDKWAFFLHGVHILEVNEE